MKGSRFKLGNDTPCAYHCVSRIVGGERLLGVLEKEVLRKQIWQVAEFCGLEVLTYCILSNHFHVFVRVPEFREVSDEELMLRVRLLYGFGSDRSAFICSILERGGSRAQVLREQLLRRMGDVSAYMKELKQRFSIYYNRSNERFGTLWAERFRSLLVEDTAAARTMVAAYVDLNPVRAGICQDPKDYRFCGYAEAVGGSRLARRGLMLLHGRDSWEACAGEYRLTLFGVGYFPKRTGGPRVDRDEARRVVEAGGKLKSHELLRCRVRYFTDGAVLGSRAFVGKRIREYTAKTRIVRKSGPQNLRGAEASELRLFRNLQNQVIT